MNFAHAGYNLTLKSNPLLLTYSSIVRSSLVLKEKGAERRYAFISTSYQNYIYPELQLNTLFLERAYIQTIFLAVGHGNFHIAFKEYGNHGQYSKKMNCYLLPCRAYSIVYSKQSKIRPMHSLGLHRLNR